MSKTKVLFLFNATTHYYNLVLNKLNESTEFAISIAVPKERTRNVGPGVFQTEDNLKIPIYPLEEKVSKYWGCHFPEFLGLLWKVRPRVIVSLEPYQWGLFWNPLIFLSLKILRVKVILKSIPFQLPNYESPLAKLKRDLKKTKLSLGDIKRHKRTLLDGYATRWFYSSAYDGHVCYVKKAYEIYGTYGVKPESIFLTYNSPDTDLLMSINEKAKLEESIVKSNPHRLIHVGRLVDWKRVDLVIRAVKNLVTKYPDIEFLVVGFGPQEAEWKQLVEDLGISAHVKFIGGIYDLDVLGRYFRASSIYVLGGMGGLSINDAMCFERPILCSVCDGTEAHLVKDGVNGYYFENGSAEDLTGKIDKMWSNPELLAKMGQSSYSIIKNEININRVLEGYTSAFNYVLGKSH